MAVKRAEWIAEIRFHRKEERMEATLSRLFFKSCCLCSPFYFCGEKRLHFMHFEPPFCFIVVLDSQKKNLRSSKIVLANFKQIHFLTNLS